MLLLWLASLASAADCGDLATLTGRAWAAFEDAELERAKQVVAEANRALACQPEVVPKQQLLDLFRVDALVSLTQQDRKGAVYATIRMVTIDPDAEPGADLGPEIAELHASWSQRLSDALATVVVTGTGEAWIDGTPVPKGGPLRAIEGEHLVQVRTEAGVLTSVVRELSGAVTLNTGGVVAPATPEVPVQVPVPVPITPPVTPKAPRTHRAGLLVGGSVIAAGGAATVALTWPREQAFLADDYHRPAFGDCAQGDPCYANARYLAIYEDAKEIRTLYAIGYGVLGLGVAIVGTELLLLPAPAGDGGTLMVRRTW